MLVDCPGYGYAKVPARERESWKKLMDLYLTTSPNLERCYILFDAETGIMDSDKMLVDYLDSQQKPFAAILTKADKVKDESKV